MLSLVRFFVFPLCLLAASSAWGVARTEIPDIYDDYDGVDLALKLVLDGRGRLAERVLKDVDNKKLALTLKSQSNLERVLGLLAEESASGKTDLDRAALHFSQALKLFESPELHFDVQRVDLARQSFATCVESVRQVKFEAATVPQLRTAIRCYRLRASEVKNPRSKNDLLVEAHSVLSTVVSAQPSYRANPLIRSEQVELLLDLGLEEEALELALATMRKMNRGGVKGVSTFALDLSDRTQSGFRTGGSRFRARLLESARYLVAEDEQEEVLAANAKLAYSEGKSLTSAMAFEQLAGVMKESKSQVQSAVIELLRLSGWRSRADSMISKIDDPKERLRARVTGFFERDETGKVAAMFPSLDRHFIEDDDWIYLGAFARLQSGGWIENGPDSPVRWLAKLKGTENREKSATLRQFVDICRTRPDLPCEL